jgi:V8-like Glu-specific endopeptidase
MATGVLVGPRHVLTAAHNLTPKQGRGPIRGIVVSPGRNGSKKPLGSFNAARWDQVHPNWRPKEEHKTRGFDYGLIVLEADISRRKYKEFANQPLGYWGDAVNGEGTHLKRLDPAVIDGCTINVAGFPGYNSTDTNQDKRCDKPMGTMWLGKGKLSGQGQTKKITSQDRLMLHTADTCPGHSGSPVWIYYPKTRTRYMVGIHVAPANIFEVIDDQGTLRRTHNLAVRVTMEMCKQLDRWMKE